MNSLTKKQHNVLQYIKEYIQANHHAPTYREIMQHFSFSSLGTVHRYIQVLRSKGVVEEKKNKNSSICLLEEATKKKNTTSVSLPFIGYIAAGEAIETFPKSISIEVPASLIESSESTYILQIRGDSLIEELMSDKDYLLVEARQEVRPGETVVALINHNDIIIRRYFLEDSYIRLVSRSPHNPPLIFREEDILIQGVVVSLIRKSL